MSSALLWLAYVHILYSGILYAQTFSPASPGWTQRKLLGGACRIQIGARAEDVINLEPLVRTDGIPRYEFAKFHTVISLINTCVGICGRYGLPVECYSRPQVGGWSWSMYSRWQAGRCRTGSTSVG